MEEDKKEIFKFLKEKKIPLKIFSKINKNFEKTHFGFFHDSIKKIIERDDIYLSLFEVKEKLNEKNFSEKIKILVKEDFYEVIILGKCERCNTESCFYNYNENEPSDAEEYLEFCSSCEKIICGLDVYEKLNTKDEFDEDYTFSNENANNDNCGKICADCWHVFCIDCLTKDEKDSNVYYCNDCNKKYKN